MTLREKIEVMEAFERGEEIECTTTGYDTNWHYVKEPKWDWREVDYRVKPKPKPTIIIEKWLCEYCGSYVVVEGNDLNFMRNEMFNKVKLLDTNEVEL